MEITYHAASMYRALARLTITMLTAAALRCGELPTQPARTLPLGEWGSSLIHVTALQTQTQFFFPGTTIVVGHPVQLDQRGEFRLSVSYPPCIGAPPPPGFQPPPPIPATIEGTLNDTTLALRVVRTDSGATIIADSLVFGSPARPAPCS